MPESVTLTTPVKGYFEGFPRGSQPPLTTPSMLNLRPRDPSGRTRVSVRPGLSIAATVGGGKIQYIGFMKFRGYNTTLGGAVGPSAGATPFKDWKLFLVVSGGVVYYGESLSSMTSAGSGLGSSAQVVGAVIGQITPPVSAATGFIDFAAAVAFADTTGIVRWLKFSWAVTVTVVLGVPNYTYTSTVTYGAPSAANGGTAPSSGVTCAVWNSRLFVADERGTWKMSRSGDPTDWDSDAEDPARAIDGTVFLSSIPNASAEPIVAAVPWTDQLMYLFSDRRCWRFNGDPAAGGSITLASPELAILGPNAWAGDADGRLWIAASGSLYRSDGSGFSSVADQNAPSFFASADRSNYFVSLFWDRQEKSLQTHFTPVAGGGTHLFYDDQNEGFWPFSYQGANGPFCAYVHDGDAASDRVTYIGGTAGRIFKIDPGIAKDQTSNDPSNVYVAINAYAFLGPVKPYEDEAESILIGCRFVLGEVPGSFTETSNWRFDYILQSGDDEYTALANPEQTRSGSYVGSAGPPATAYQGRLPSFGVRIAGEAHFLKISNGNTADKLFVFERANLEFEAGRRIV